jgi:hypothetical protein
MSFKLGVTTIRTENGGDPAAQSLIFSGTGKARWHGADAGLLEADHNNISSMDDDGTGDRGINLTAAMSDANY